MIYLVYASSAVRLFTREELADLLAVSRANNARDGITGMLALQGRQLLAGARGGARSRSRRCTRRSSATRGTRGILTLLRGPLEERAFPDWSMGFRDLDSPEVRSDPAFSEFLNTPLTGEEFSANPHRAQKLLLTFKRYM